MPEPAGDRRDAGRGPLRARPPLLARAGRRGRRAASARIMELPVRRHLPHRARGLRGPALRPTRALEARMRRRSGAFYGHCDVVLSPEPGVRRARCAPGRRRRAASGAGTAASTSRASRRRKRDAGRCPASSTSSTPAGSRRRRAPTCWPMPSSPPARATRACTSCWPAAARRRSACASGSASARPSSAGSRATRSRAPTPSADVFLFASRTDTFGQVMLEAQARGVPVVAVAEGGPS